MGCGCGKKTAAFKAKIELANTKPPTPVPTPVPAISPEPPQFTASELLAKIPSL